ncbi:MAG TPA: HypC/HybG/HupF family hydrogenase formation chaperone [Opitutaceae bacterium]|nr:HypC/HybG/HupF family hydrogenase formation chaperone [Opitutaceae bacterium]
MCLAVPGRVIEIAPGNDCFRTGRVSFGGTIREVNLSFVPEARIDDYVLVHVGLALSVIEDVEARAVFAQLAAMDELADSDPP